MIEFRAAERRFRTESAGRTTRHSFSFGAHYDPANVGFAALVALNEEHLPAGTGYAEHPHAGVEIVTWVLEGSLRHTSSVGAGVITRGQVQRLSAGSGVTHSEVSEGPGGVRFLQAWLRADRPDSAPDYCIGEVRPGEGWTCVASGRGQGAVPVATTGAELVVAVLRAGRRIALPDAPRLHLHVTRGRLLLAERTLGDGDAALLRDEGGRGVTAEEDAEVLVWSFRE